MVKAKIIVYAKAFNGLPKENDFKIVEEELPALEKGQFLAEAIYLSVDPYMRSLVQDFFEVGAPIFAQQVAKVIDSKNPKFPVGTYIVGSYGWRTYTIAESTHEPNAFLDGWIMPQLGNLSLSLGTGLLGMPGFTAYFGTLEVLRPKAGDTVVVSGAAGAVGSIVGQIAKIKGAKVIGIAGSEEKGKWLVNELGFDHFINYKTADVGKTLEKLAPEGVDRYFDNVGGDITNAVGENLKNFGHIAVCGAISSYNEGDPRFGVKQMTIIMKQLSIEGFTVHRWTDKWQECASQLAKWFDEGKIKYRETITEGFEMTPIAFIDLLKGGNTGKAVVKV